MATAPDGKIPTSELSGKDAARIRDVCGRDEILCANFEIVHQGLRVYLDDLPTAVPRELAPIGRLAAASRQMAASGPVSACNYGQSPTNQMAAYSASDKDGATGQGDVEFWVAPVVQVITGYILPFAFGVIGSLLYVLLQHYTSLRANLLEPRDHALAYIRIVLGIVVAASVSLLLTSTSEPSMPLLPPSSGSTPPNSLVGSLTFSASLITFLAGFGAEAVFTLLQNLVDRVFAVEKA
jgi:hypothetical protein